MSKVVRVQEGDYKILLGKSGIPSNFIIDTNAGSFNGSTGEVIIKGDLSVTGNAPSPEVSNVLYVTVDGDDANSGKGEGPKQAKRTIKAAVAVAQEGTTIFVRSGEYYEDNPIRLPPKVSIVGDNLRRTILRPLNGPRKFSATNVRRDNTVVTVTTSTPHEFKLHDRVRVIIPNPASPKDRTTHILDTECANITEIVNDTTFKYIDPNFTDLPLTSTSIGTVEQGVDFFLVTTQSYIAQLVFKGFRAPGYCLNIDKDAIVDTSPYIQNCSNINGPWLNNGTEWLPFITEQPNLNGGMVTGARPLRDDEIDPAQVDQYGINDRGAGGGMLIDGDRYNSESPLKSMVADAFTQVAQGAVGFHISNFGYMQLVSCFAVFCDKAFYTTNGGYMSISNSVIDFGNYGFLADGFYPIPYATGLVTDAYYSKVGSITVDTEGAGYTSAPAIVIAPPTVPPPDGIQATALINIDSIRGTVNAITPDNQGGGYTFIPTVTIDPPFTPFVNWQAGLSVTNGQYILFNRREYQVVGNGILGTDGPTHTSGTQPSAGGTVSLTLVGAQATASVNLSTNTSINVAQLSEKPQVGSILFVGDDPIGYYIKATNTSDLGFRFNEIKCRRDVKYIVDAVLSDAIFNTNVRTLYAARAYLRSYSSKVLSLQKSQTLNGILVAKNDVLARLQTIPSLVGTRPFQTAGDNRTVFGIIEDLFNLVIRVIFPEFNSVTDLPGDPSVPADGIQANDPRFNTSVPNPDIAAISLPAPTGRTAGFVEAGNILQSNKSYIQDQIVKYINDAYKGFVYDSDVCSRDVGLILDAVSYDLITGSNFATIVAGSAYQRAQASGVTGGQLPQTLDAIRYARDLTVPLVEGSIQFRIAASFTRVLEILELGLNAAPGLVFESNSASTVETIAASNLIRSNLVSYQNAVINYITTTYPALVYDQATCRRDVEYIVNAVSYDLLYGGNYQSVIAGEAYYSGAVLQLPVGEKTATLDAYDFLRTQLTGDIVDVPTSIEAGNLINDIISIIDTGTSPAVTYPSATGEDTVIQNGFNSIQANKSVIQSSVIVYIDSTYNSLGYNEEKCARDVGLIINAVFDDLIFGSNYRSKTAGLSYLRSYSSKVTDKQKVPTIGGIERARDLVLKYLQDELDSEVTVKNLFDLVIDIIRKESYLDIPTTFYTDPVDGVLGNSRVIEASKQDIINDVIEFIKAELNPAFIVNYEERLCKRDLNLILEAIIFDLMYGSNSATITVANSFYDAGGLNVVSTQIEEHVDAFNYLKLRLGNTPTTNGLIDIIINAIRDGQASIPVVINQPDYTRGSLNSYYVNFRTKILGLLPSIQDEVIEYINTRYAINFDYNEETCRRDISYILDALTYDLTYGGNTQITNAALAYSEGSVIAGEINETVAAYKYWKEILPFILQNQPVPNSTPGQVFTTLPGNPVPEYYPAFIAQNLLQIVIDCIDYGPGYVPEPVTESEFNLGAGSILVGGNSVLTFKALVIDDILLIQNGVIDYLNIKYGGNINVELFPGIVDIPTNTVVKFHNVSTISTGGTALEYVGAGVTYNALPFFGGEPIPEQERIELNSGRCFTVTNDQVGNFRVGEFFAVDALTGGVTIDANNVSLGGISSIGPFKREGIPVGVELQEVSNNPALISSLGTQDVNTVPTQFAVATFVENRYLNKVQSGTPQTVESEVAFQTNVIVEGNLTVNGLTTTIESTNLVVEDPNITIGKDNTTDAQANGGGITLKGATDKTINWIDATDAWTSSENLNLANTKVYRINGTDVLSSSAVLDNVATATAFSTATSLTIGATTGTATIRNASTILSGDLEVRGGDLTTNQTTFNLVDTTASTVNFARASTSLTIGSTIGTTTIRNANTVVTGDLAVNGGDLTTSATTFNLLDSTATTVNAFGSATAIDIGAATGTLTINNTQTVFNSTDSIQIPVGDTSQRDITPVAGQIRYNSQLSSFEGYGPGNAWGSLGGVKDVDGNTYIIPETAPGANENILYFYNNGVLTATLSETNFNLNPNVTISTSNANNIAIGTPQLGILDGAVDMITSTSLTDGVAQLNQILTLLVPLPPPNFPNAQNLTINSTSSRIMFTAAGSQTLNGTGITTPAAGTIVQVIRGNTFSTSTIADTGPGTRGVITVNRNSSAAVTKTLTYGNTTQTISTFVTGTTAIGSNVVQFTQPSVGVLFPGYLILTGGSGAFGGLANNSYYYITAVTSTTLSLSNYNATTGAIGAAFSATSVASGSLSFTSVSDNGTYTSNNTSLVVGDNVAFPTTTPGFHETIDLSVSGTAVPAGWNTVQIAHAQAGSTTIGANTTNTGLWYYDNSATVAPTFASQTFALNTASLTYSSTIPHYNSSTVYDLGFNLTWNAGQTGHPSTASNVLTTAAVGPWTSAGNKSYAALGYSVLPTSAVVTAGAGPNASTFRTNIISGFGAWTTTTTVPQYTADNSYTTANSALPALGAIILYKTGTTSSTTFLDESNIFFSVAVGGSTTGATRCVNPDVGTAAQDTPAFTAGATLFNSTTGTFYSTDATVVGTGTGVNSLRHDVTNYSTGYLPAGPNLSGRTAANAQYFTFRFTRTGVGKFGIVYTTSTGVAAIYCAMPGANGTALKAGNVNSWLNLSIDNSLNGGCALGGNQSAAATGTLTYNCSFGTLSSTDATNNEIWVRIKLNQGQSITSLYLRDSTV